MENLQTIIKHTIKSYECGPDNLIRQNNIFLLFQEAAYLSAENLGFGYTHLTEMNLTWVLSNIKLQIISLPAWGDEIEVMTYPSGFNRLTGFREFIVRDKSGNNLALASSDWLAIELATRRPININNLRKPLPGSGERVIDDQMVRLNPKRFSNCLKIEDHLVRYSSIDENGHVNNSEYVKWGLDSLRKMNHSIENIFSLQVTFLAESFENEICELYYSEVSEKEKLIYGLNPEKQEHIFALQIIYK